MRRAINYSFLIIVAILTVFGILFLATLSAPASLQIFGNTNYYLFHQLFALLIGTIAGLIVYKVPLNIFKKLSLILFFINLLLLIMVFFPIIGTEFWGAKRWISIGKNTFQPSEFFKITAILYISAWLSNRMANSSKKNWSSWLKNGYYSIAKIFLPFLFFLGIIAVILYLQKDISTLGIIGIALIAVYFAAGTPIWHFLLVLITGFTGIILFIIQEPYRVQRIKVFFNPETDPLGIGLQLKQSLIAIGSGGIFGNGWGMSTQKFGFLPQAMSDSTFAILGEETGIIGTSILILLFVLFFWQGIRISNKATDKFAKLTSVGITTWIASQAFINIASSLGIFPLSGIPLPFFSYGGSHIIAEMIGVGILLNISKNG